MINEKFNIDFQNDLTVYSEYNQKLATVFSSGNIPDVIGFVAPDTWAPMKKTEKLTLYRTFQQAD